MRIIFYEKPGCIGNTRQRAVLTVAGHTLEVRNLLTHSFERQELRSYFGTMRVADWFNRNAPRVKSGEVVPEQFDEDGAIELLLREPLLVRRPLLDLEGTKLAGFDLDAIARVIGPLPTNGRLDWVREGDFESCPGELTGYRCPDANASSAAASSVERSPERAESHPDQT